MWPWSWLKRKRVVPVVGEVWYIHSDPFTIPPTVFAHVRGVKDGSVLCDLSVRADELSPGSWKGYVVDERFFIKYYRRLET